MMYGSYFSPMTFVVWMAAMLAFLGAFFLSYVGWEA